MPSFNFTQSLEEVRKPSSFNFTQSLSEVRKSATEPDVAPVEAPATEPVVKPDAAPVEAPVVEPQPVSSPAQSDTAWEDISAGEFAASSFENAGDQEVTFLRPEDVARQPERIEAIKDYMAARYPNKDVPSNTLDLVTSYQKTLAKSDLDMASDLNWAINATPEQKQAAQRVQETSELLQTTISDELKAVVVSPSTYLTGIGGAVAKKAAVKKFGTTLAAKMITTAAPAAIEATTGATTNIITQKTKQATGVQKEFDYKQIAASVGVSAVFGGAEGFGISKTITDPKAKMKALVERKAKSPEQLRDSEQEFLNQFISREKEVYTEPLFPDSTVKAETRAATLDVIDEPTDVTKAVLNQSTVKDIFATAKQIFKDNPHLIPDDFQNKKITQIIVDVLEKSDSDTIQQAATRAGIDPKEFLQTFKVTLSDAGEVMQGASAMARFFSKVGEGVDPDLEKAINHMMGASGNQKYSDIFKPVREITDASVGAAVSGLSTTILNAAGLVGALTINTAVDLMDSTIKHTSRLVSDMKGGAITGARLKETKDSVMRDGFEGIGFLFDSGYSDELYTAVMKYNPRLDGMLLQSAQGADEIVGKGSNKAFDAMNKTVNLMNTFNRGVETWVRKPMFVHTLRSRMDDLGLDFEDFVANNKPIPPSILREAVNDTLSLTFSSGFRKTKGAGFEADVENLAATAISEINKNNITKSVANVVFPFFRFSLNGLRYSYRLTPFSGAAGSIELKRAVDLKKQSDAFFKAGNKVDGVAKKQEADGVAYEAKRKMIEAAVGTSMIAYAMGVREDNADLPFTKMRDSNGQVHDISTLAPMTFLLAMADVALFARDAGKEMMYTLAMTQQERVAEAQKIRKEAMALGKNAKGRQEMMNKAELLELGRIRTFDGVKFSEIMSGMGRMAGTQKTIFDSVRDLTEEGITTSAARKAGTTAGDFISRFDNFFNPVYDVVNFMREDFRQVESRGETTLNFNSFADAMVASLVSNVPVARDVLENKPSLFQEPTAKQALATKYLTGVKLDTPTSPVENELLRLGIEPYKMYQRTGDRTFDNIRTELAREPFMKGAAALLASEQYSTMPVNTQQNLMTKVASDAFSSVTEDAANVYAARKGDGREIDRKYQKMSTKERQSAEDIFTRVNGRKPTTLADKVDILDGRYKMSPSDISTQTKSAFSK